MSDAASEPARTAARNAWDISRRLCQDCSHYHGTRPYLRLARVYGATERSAETWGRVADLAAAGLRRVLIAATDGEANVRRMLHALSAQPGCLLEVVDRCPTPLEIVRGSPSGADPRLRLRVMDLLQMPAEGDMDLVFMDRLLRFVASDQQVSLLSRLRGRLVAGGSLLMVEVVGDHMRGDSMPAEFVDYVLQRLAERGIPLPVAREEFAAELRRMREGRAERKLRASTAEQLVERLTGAGFAVQSLREIDGHGYGEGDPSAGGSRRRLLIEARNSGAPGAQGS